MFEFTFGLSWTIFMIFFTIPFLITKEVNLFAILVIGGFWIIGIVILVKGIKKVVANHKTEKFGEECYALIKSIYRNGNKVNHRPQFNAEFLVYVPSKNTLEQVTEDIGFNNGRYQVDTFIKGKYYNGDINVKEVVDYNTLPLNIRPSFEQLMSKDTNSDIITIDGVKYKRID